MKNRTKFILTFFGGVVAGIVLTIIFALIVARSQQISEDNNMVLFEQPQNEIQAYTMEVIQVLPNGNALATVRDVDENSNYGLVVMFLADHGQTYYDNQKITVRQGECLRVCLNLNQIKHYRI